MQMERIKVQGSGFKVPRSRLLRVNTFSLIQPTNELVVDAVTGIFLRLFHDPACQADG